MISKSLEVFKIAFHKRNAIEGLQSEPCTSMRAIFPHQLCLKMDSRVLGKCTTVCFWSIFDFRTHWYQPMQSKTHLATQGFIIVRIIKWLVHFQNSLWRSLWETITLLEPSPPSSETGLRQFSVLKKSSTENDFWLGRTEKGSQVYKRSVTRSSAGAITCSSASILWVCENFKCSPVIFCWANWFWIEWFTSIQFNSIQSSVNSENSAKWNVKPGYRILHGLSQGSDKRMNHNFMKHASEIC